MLARLLVQVQKETSVNSWLRIAVRPSSTSGSQPVHIFKLATLLCPNNSRQIRQFPIADLKSPPLSSFPPTMASNPSLFLGFGSPIIPSNSLWSRKLCVRHLHKNFVIYQSLYFSLSFLLQTNYRWLIYPSFVFMFRPRSCSASSTRFLLPRICLRAKSLFILTTYFCPSLTLISTAMFFLTNVVGSLIKLQWWN